MTNPESDKFAEFFADSQNEQAIQEEQAIAANRFQLFLSERGIIFDAETFLNDPLTSNIEFIDPEEIRLLSTANLQRVQILSAYKIISDTPDLPRHIADDLKKQMQAMMLAQGCDDVWLDLINAEFPGEPLTDDDSGYIFGNSVIRALIMETNSVELSRIRDNIVEYLSEHDRVELALEEIETLHAIALNLLILTMRDNDRLRGNLAENMRLMIIEQGLDLDLWNGLVSHFFEIGSE